MLSPFLMASPKLSRKSSMLKKLVSKNELDATRCGNFPFETGGGTIASEAVGRPGADEPSRASTRSKAEATKSWAFVGGDDDALFAGGGEGKRALRSRGSDPVAVRAAPANAEAWARPAGMVATP